MEDVGLMSIGKARAESVCLLRSSFSDLFHFRGKTDPDPTKNKKNTYSFYNFFLLITQKKIVMLFDEPII